MNDYALERLKKNEIIYKHKIYNILYDRLFLFLLNFGFKFNGFVFANKNNRTENFDLFSLDK